MTAGVAYEARISSRTCRRRLRGLEHCIHEWGEPGQAPLVLLHGWGDTGASFQFLVDALRNGRFIVAPDWRGFGDSAHNTGAYWFPDYLADLDALLRSYRFEAPVPLLGHSMGGNVAALFAGVFPERVSALINVEGFGLPDSDPDDAPARYRSWVERTRRPSVHAGYGTLQDLATRIREKNPGLDEARIRYVAASWARRGEDGRYYLKADPAHRWPNPVLYRRAEARACWRRISAPTLLVRGGRSGLAAAGTGWQDGELPIPGAVVREINAAGHMVHLEQPAALAVLVETFLAGHGL